VSARTKARKRALDALYEADIKGTDARETLAATEDTLQAPLNPYTSEIVDGVYENLDQIDDLISTYSQGWTIDRMPAVDRNIVRIGVYELIWNPDVPVGVAISEAVDLAKLLSTDESGSFVNGLLARIADVNERSGGLG
jgi:N utilization substance protein B